MAQLWCTFPKKHQLCKSPAEDNNLVPTKVAFAHQLVLASCKSEWNPYQTWACLFQEGASAESTSHGDLDPRQSLAHAWRGFFRRDRGYSGQSGAQRRDAQHLGEHIPPSSPTGRAAGRAAEHLCEVLEHPRDHTGLGKEGAHLGRGAESKSWAFSPSPTEGMLPN